MVQKYFTSNNTSWSACLQHLSSATVNFLRPGTGSTCLHHAAVAGSATNGGALYVERLVELGAHVNAMDDFGNTPLAIAVLMGNNLTVRLLLEEGADPFLGDSASWVSKYKSRREAEDCIIAAYNIPRGKRDRPREWEMVSVPPTVTRDIYPGRSAFDHLFLGPQPSRWLVLQSILQRHPLPPIISLDGGLNYFDRSLHIGGNSGIYTSPPYSSMVLILTALISKTPRSRSASGLYSAQCWNCLYKRPTFGLGWMVSFRNMLQRRRKFVTALWLRVGGHILPASTC